MSLFASFEKVLRSFGVERISHPVFYNSKIAIRFNIGDNGNDIYIDESNGKFTVNEEYIDDCLERALQIYNHLENAPDLLVIEGYTYEKEIIENFISSVMSATGLTQPQETKIERAVSGGDEVERSFLCWKLKDYNPQKLMKSIITADLGSGNDFLTSSVYFVCTKDNVLFHLYDDRGADLVADKKEKIYNIYNRLNHLILDYNRERIDNIFNPKAG